ncbi:CidA/LrgA family protein [Acidovorax sp. SDU_ACID1]|uniref:CidA/LrgA family protein n=1 Tax=Acidovorax sp. SDU_ACID1 TaxID=3136632 RepID=UPI003873C30F
MVYALTALFAFQLLGELLVQWLHLPLPGALAGMLLLLAALLAYGRVPDALERMAGSLLQNMMLLFIPAIAGVMLHFERIAREWLPFLVAGIAGAAITLAVTAWTLRWLLRDSADTRPAEEERT